MSALENKWRRWEFTTPNRCTACLSAFAQRTVKADKNVRTPLGKQTMGFVPD